MYQLETAESLTEGFRRIAVEQLEQALAMAGSVEDMGLSVHAIRKTCKRMRALLRLVRTAFEPATWRIENRALRDVARGLRSHRESAVRLKTIDKIGAPATPFRGVASWVANQVGNTAWADLTQAERRLRTVAQRASGWPFGEINQEVVEAGFERIIRQGAMALAEVEKKPTSEYLHEWRKQVKYAWYATRLLTDKYADHEGTRNQLEELSDWLGTEHDLADLQSFVAALALTSTAKLEGVIRERQLALRKQILDLGRPLFVRLRVRAELHPGRATL